MIDLLLFLIALWVLGIWIVIIGVFGVALVILFVLAWRLAWAVAAFVVRFLTALVFGPERGAR